MRSRISTLQRAISLKNPLKWAALPWHLGSPLTQHVRHADTAQCQLVQAGGTSSATKISAQSQVPCLPITDTTAAVGLQHLNHQSRPPPHPFPILSPPLLSSFSLGFLPPLTTYSLSIYKICLPFCSASTRLPAIYLVHLSACRLPTPSASQPTRLHASTKTRELQPSLQPQTKHTQTHHILITIITMSRVTAPVAKLTRAISSTAAPASVSRSGASLLDSTAHGGAPLMPKYAELLHDREQKVCLLSTSFHHPGELPQTHPQSPFPSKTPR